MQRLARLAWLFIAFLMKERQTNGCKQTVINHKDTLESWWACQRGSEDKAKIVSLTKQTFFHLHTHFNDSLGSAKTAFHPEMHGKNVQNLYWFCCPELQVHRTRTLACQDKTNAATSKDKPLLAIVIQAETDRQTCGAHQAPAL